MNCYICKTPMTFFIEKNAHKIFSCPVCGLKTTELSKNYDKFISSYYSKDYFTGDPSRSAYVDYGDDRVCITRNFRSFFKKIQAIKKSGSILDVGCAYGYFVQMAKDAGFDAYGFDPSEYAVKRASQSLGNPRVRRGTIQSISYPKKLFDIITLFDVFEHLIDPLKDIKKLSSFLKKDGLIIIATGDTDSIAACIFKRRWTFYIPPQHLFFYNKKNLTILLEKASFKPIQWFRIGKWVNLRYILHLARTTGESYIADRIYSKIASLQIAKLPLYVPMKDNIVVIAKKRSR